MWRGDAARSAVSNDRLADRLSLQWSLKLPPQVVAWRDEESMQFDRSYRPIVLGGLVLVGSTRNDRLTAYDLGTGAERWRFYTEGPIRVAPAGLGERVFVASDDGCLYCLGLRDGRLLWKFRGGPSDRRLVGNERVISTWPARGGPVVADGRVYCAFGVWPFMGTFVYALEAASGEVVWHNDATSFTWRRLPHPGSAAFSGLSPQGHLVAAGDRLIVPGSRFKPAIFDRASGEFLGYAEGFGPEVAAAGEFGFAGGSMFDLKRGWAVRCDKNRRFGLGVLGDGAWWIGGGVFDPRSLRFDQKSIRVKDSTQSDGRSHEGPVLAATIKESGRLRGTPWLKAGSRLVVSDGPEIGVFELDGGAVSAEPVWQAEIDGTPSSVLSADGRLIVVTLEGTIACFGPDPAAPKTYDLTRTQPARPNAWDAAVREILKASGASEGYCLVWGLKDGGLVDALVRASRLHVVAVDRDAAKIDALRRRLDAAGLYGTRAAAIVADPLGVSFATYLADLIVSEDAGAAGLGRAEDAGPKLCGPLRPYGGTACLPLSAGEHAGLGAWFEKEQPEGFEIARSGAWTVVGRVGPLPGAADWQGQNADAGNTRFSRDERVAAPLGVLWFGNALSNSLILPRHGEGPVEQVTGGRLLIEGADSLSAMDVYTGRALWTREFPGLGRPYDSTRHQPGAHSIGSNFYAVPDAVYVAAGPSCQVLDPETGRTQREFKLPEIPQWQFLMVYEDLLVAGADPIVDRDQEPGRTYSPTSSRRLVVLDRRSGKVLWTRDAEESFRHYGICAGEGKIFCVDRVAPETLALLARRGRTPDETPRIVALAARSGQVVWQTDRFVSEKLSYSREHGLLIAGAALRGADGSLVWQNPECDELLWYGKWGVLLGDRWIYTQGPAAFDLLTGARRMAAPAGGREEPWNYPRSYGCGPKAGARNLITFRSGCAGYCDLEHDGGTGNLGGFRSGCTSNLIAADGVLSAPDYTRTCTCNYQNRSSLALVHMPEAEYWTHGAFAAAGRAGFNFGAPGDRRSAEGTLWKAVPNVVDEFHGIRSPLELAPASARPFYDHSSRVLSEGGLPWVAASGVEGIRSILLPLDGFEPGATVTVRLWFAEPDEAARPGDRVFSVACGGRGLLGDFDPVQAAGGARRAVVREFAGLRPGRSLGGKPAVELTFSSQSGQPLVCGVEVIAESDGPAK